MNNLAVSYAALGRQAEALNLREETLTLQKAKLGPDHPDTLGSMYNLAISYAALGRHAEALKSTKRRWPAEGEAGPRPPRHAVEHAQPRHQYARLGRQAGRWSPRGDAGMRKVKLGPDHPDTLASMNNLATSYAALGRQAEALRLRVETLACGR